MSDKKEINGLAKFLLRRTMPDELPVELRNAKLGELEGWMSTAVSLFLVILKGLLAVFSGSVALLADTLNNLGDLVGSIVLIVSFRLSQKPRDAKHPYGHGRMRTVAGLILAIILIVVGVEAARSGVTRIIHPQPITVTPWLLTAIAASIVLKAFLAAFARMIARITRDEALSSEAWNHFYDIFSTGLVLLSLICERFNIPGVDGLAGIIISGFIIYTGVHYAKETAGILIGRAPSPQELTRLYQLALQVDGVEGVHDAQIHEYGNMRLISLHIETDAAISSLECHSLTEKTEALIAEHWKAKVIVHGDPINLNHPAYRSVSGCLRELISSSPDFITFHDLRIEDTAPALTVAADLVTDHTVVYADFSAKADLVREYIIQKINGIASLDIGIETEYASDPEFRKHYQLK